MSTPEFSISKSRISLFQECLKKYFFHYYWWSIKDDVTLDRRKISALKQMENVYIAIGDAVHRAAGYTIEKAQGVNELPQYSFLLDTVHKIFMSKVKSSFYKSRWLNQPKDNQMLQEIYYAPFYFPFKLKVKSSINKESVDNRFDLCLSHLLKSKTLAEFKSKYYLSIQQQEELATFFVDDEKVYVKLDLLYQDADKLIIVDWKTGSTEETPLDDLQMKIYALFVNRKYQVPLDQIEVRKEYLLSGQHIECSFKDRDIAEVEEMLKDWIRTMKNYIVDDQNTPISIDEFSASPGYMKCQHCNFKEVCIEGITEIVNNRSSKVM